MHGIDESIDFVGLRLAVLTVSDSRGLAEDLSGALLCERIGQSGHILAGRELVRDDIGQIRRQLGIWIVDPEIDAVICCGGTGLTGRDVTPEAAKPLFDKLLDGFSVIFHQISYQSVGLSTIQSRACAGLAGSTLIFCLPGSRGAVRDGWDKIISLLLDSRHRPCNLVELLPRFARSD